MAASLIAASRSIRVGLAVSAGLCLLGAFAACSGDSTKAIDDPDTSGGSPTVGGASGRGGGAGAGGSAGSAGSGTGGKGGSAGDGPQGGKGGGVGDGGGSGEEPDGGSDACVPRTCEDEGATCGVIQDTCGEEIQCGECPAGCGCGDDNRCSGDDAEDEERRHAGRARSSGFMGTETQYNELYDLPPCFSADDCYDPCIDRGGTESMCNATLCQDSTEDYCLPATIWTGLATLSAEGTDPLSDAAQLVLWSDPYRDFLLLDDFRLEVPAAAEIRGITVTVRRAGGGPNEAVDAGVRLIKGGVMGQSDRSSPMPWSGPELSNVDYGGATDLWGATWTPEDVNAPDFGVALSAAYTQSAGNGRAYVDIVYVTVSYTLACE
jgi:hypothetical protein